MVRSTGAQIDNCGVEGLLVCSVGDLSGVKGRGRKMGR